MAVFSLLVRISPIWALVGVWSGWGFLRLAERLGATQNYALRLLTTGCAGWISMQTAALACVSELLFSGHESSSQLLANIWSTHAVIGIGEATIAVACAAVLLNRTSQSFATSDSLMQNPATQIAAPASSRSRWIAGIAIFTIAVMALAISPWASSLEDGLEWTIAKSNLTEITDLSAPTFSWQLTDYQVPAWGENLPSLWIAGSIGLASVMFCTLFLQKLALIQKSKTVKIKSGKN